MKKATMAAWQEQQRRFHGIDIRLTRLENAWRTEQLMDKLPPNSLNYVEAF
jgi:hypothetical protein